MELKFLILFCFNIFLFGSYYVEAGKCEIYTALSGTIYMDQSFYRTPSYVTRPWYYTTYAPRTTFNRCWYINPPEDNYVRLSITDMDMRDPYCYYAYIEVIEDNSEVKSKICHDYSNQNWTRTILGGVEVNVTITRNYWRDSASFTLNYHIESVACSWKDSVRCSPHQCVHSNKVCDGKVDCENGKDEEGCGILDIQGVNTSLVNSVNWLKERQSDFGWGRNTHRAITALFLSGAAKFRGNKIEEEMMVKQFELKAIAAILRNSTAPLSVNELSMYVNALSLTCHTYRSFFGNDLLKILASRTFSSPTATPGAYLTLCNADWPFAESNVLQLLNLLTKETKYPFVYEIQAMTVMALSCIQQKTNLFQTTYNASEIYNSTIENFMANQKRDGSFGNVHTTAMVTQALFSSGQKENKLWNSDNAIRFLVKNVNSSTVDFLSIYLTLPLFRGKTLVDLGSMDCSEYQRKLGDDDDVSDVIDKLVGKITVQYSLYIGNDKDVVHTLYLKVPENSTAFDVMKIAQVAVHRYRFSYSYERGHLYIYKIAGITNDMEVGKFWLLYKADSNKTKLTQYTTSPDEIVVGDKEHLIMWYKTVDI